MSESDENMHSKSAWKKIQSSRDVLHPGHEDSEGELRQGGLAVPDSSANDRRGSVISQMSWSSQHRCSIDSNFSQVIGTNIEKGKVEELDDDFQIDNANTSNDSYTRAAIPYMPLPLAILCLVLNIFLPGIGTMIAGLSILCGTRIRFSSKDGTAMTALSVNICVGVGQIFTISFMLVGWFWSFIWGIYMVILAVERNTLIKAKKEKQLQAKTLTAMNDNIRPWTLKTG